MTPYPYSVKCQGMEQIITIEKRNVYGNELIYIVSNHAEAIRRLTGKKTIDQNDIANLEQLGFTIRYK